MIKERVGFVDDWMVGNWEITGFGVREFWYWTGELGMDRGR